MSVVTRPQPTPDVAPAAPAPDELRPGRATAAPRDSLGLRVAAFSALAAFGAFHWMGLIADPPSGRAFLLVAVAAGGALALGRLHDEPPGRRYPLAVGVVVLVFALGFLAAGMGLYYLWPAHWDDLADGLNRGMAGIRTVNWPYEGMESWVRDTILLGAPLLLGLATALAFWPARRGATARRAGSLVCLLVLYGTAVTEHDPGSPVLRGLLLLLLIAAWLWLPKMSPRDAGRGAVMVLALGVIAIPLSARLDADAPWWDYRAWDWFGSGKVVSFNWQHSYGPLDWPRDGTTLLNVKAERPHYWKAETLDAFDGLRWRRIGTSSSIDAANRGYGELPSENDARGPSWDYYEFNPRWDEEIEVTVRALRSDLVVGAGTTYQVFGAGRTQTFADGTTFKYDEPLEKGDTYTVRSYAPDPTPAQMRGAPEGYSSNLATYTTLFLPPPGVTARQDDTFGGFANPNGRGGSRRAVVPNMWGSPEGPSTRAERSLENSPYADVYGLARRLTDGRENAYDAVAAVQNHLRRNYRYNERPPTQEYPLAAFLFEDKIGYCQQFSGAMALMLRMVGIPARVATGFTRGSYNRDTGEHRVRDLDAHSWVEVNFTGIGWVTFDPTPAATPAEGQAPNLGGALGALSGGDQAGGAPGTSDRSGDPTATAGGSDDGLGWWLAPVLGALVLAAAATGLSMRRARRHRSLPPEARSEALLGELPRALRRLGWRIPAGTTLLGLEPRLRRMSGSASARYAAALRDSRYDPGTPEPPGLAERRAVRRELAGPRGLRGRLLALIALPPGGPRAR